MQLQNTQTETTMSLEKLFYQVDDFCQVFMPEWEATLVNEAIGQKPWQCQMSASKIMTIMMLFHQDHGCRVWQRAFPKRLSYSRFVEQKNEWFFPCFSLCRR